MTATGAIIAGTGTSVARGTSTAWTNPGNITANDGTVASCNSGNTGSAYLRASNFGFNLPANSLIQGFTVVVEMAESSPGSETVSVQLVGAAGTAIGNAKTFSANGTTLTVYTVPSSGGATDLWGTTGLTATDVNDTDFGVYVWYTTTHNTTVDYISINVDYAPPISGSLAATESGSDTASVSGKVLVSGSLSVTESGADTASFNGVVVSVITGTLAATETGSDTALVNGKVLVTGSLNASETGSDTASISGNVLVYGSLNASESGSDTAAISGSVLISGSLAATESGTDTAAISGKVLVSGFLDATEVGQDVANFTGSTGAEIFGSLDATETGQDTASFVGKNVTPIVTAGGGGFSAYSSRKALVKAAERLLGLMTAVKQTKRVKAVVKRLEKEVQDPDEQTLENITQQAILELEAQKRVSEFMVEIRQLQETIAYLKAIQKQIEDDEETLLILM